MTRFLSIGSNIDPQIHVPDCLKLLQQKIQVRKFSSVYETDPVGPAGNRKFWNLAAQIETDLNRDELQKKLREIESALGRTRGADKFAARTIDLDILPQADYQNQAFIMIPLAEIAAEEIDEETGLTFGELAKRIAHLAEDFKKIPTSDLT